RRAHRPPFPLRPPEEGFVVLDVLAIAALQQTEPDDFSWIIPQDLPDRHEFTEALRHLLPYQRQEPVVHPGPRPVDTPGALADHRFALVMGEDQIEAAPMDVEGRAEVLERHRVAFDMPPRPPGSPGARPG